MRVLVPVFVIAIIAVTVLLVVRSMNRTRELKSEVRSVTKRAKDVEHSATELRVTIAQARRELELQITAGYFDPAPLQAILNNDKDTTTT